MGWPRAMIEQLQAALASPMQRVVSHQTPFTLDDAQRAGDEWQFNCGPAALCAVLGMTPDAIRPMMGDFEGKGYTNPTLMLDILARCNASFRVMYRGDVPNGLPKIEHGLMRVQWTGPWTKPGVPMRARYRQTHWVAVRGASREIFDVNAMCVGGWLPRDEWALQLVPWLIRECCPKGDGGWWPTHALEVVPNVRAKAEPTAPQCLSTD
jgi:hypothetical protein